VTTPPGGQRSSARPIVIGTVAPARAACARGRQRHEHVHADLDVQHESGHFRGGEQQAGSERHIHVAHPDGAVHIVAGGELSAFVELR
jgi:hypothetical protein